MGDGFLKYILLNLKRFDIPTALGGVNSIAAPKDWAEYIVSSVKAELESSAGEAEFSVFFPEAHILPAKAAGFDRLHIGCQGVCDQDVAAGGNFGAFTTLRTAKSMRALGCDCTIIGHCEERAYLNGLADAFGGGREAVDAILNREISAAVNAGLKVLYCVGEKQDEHARVEKVLKKQLDEGLKNVDLSGVIIGYEPLWAIGPGRPTPTVTEIRNIVRYIKSRVPCPVVYGGGLKESNAEMIASIPELDGGLIALTRFQGEIGFYPEEYLRIIGRYLSCACESTHSN